jgi:hypothetical protein
MEKCSTCKWWMPFKRESDSFANCNKLNLDPDICKDGCVISTSTDEDSVFNESDDLETGRNFGCIYHEPI